MTTRGAGVPEKWHSIRRTCPFCLKELSLAHMRPHINTHCGRGLPPKERFFNYVDKNGSNGCWNWTGSKSAKTKGRKLPCVYGGFRLNGGTMPAHRASYEIHKGKIPTGLQIDHLCRNTLCVNPAHLEAVTNEVNVRRGFEFRMKQKALREAGEK